MVDRQNYIVRNGVAQPYPIPDAARPTISEMRQLLRGYDQVGTLLPNAAILVNENSWVDVLRCGTLYADNIAGIVAETWTNPEPVLITLGGVEAGDVLTGLSAIDILERILYPYLAVSVLSFNMNYNTGTLYEIGQTTPNTPLFPTWSLENISNATSTGTSITYVSSGGSTGSVLNGADPSGSYVIIPPAINSNTVGATLTYTLSVAQNEGSPATKTETLSWRSKIYVGKNASSNYTTITNFNELTNGTSQFITSNSSPAASGLALTVGSGFVYIFVHTSLNALTSVSIGSTDQTPAFPLVSSSHTVTNSTGASSTYRVYKSSNLLNGDFTLNIT